MFILSRLPEPRLWGRLEFAKRFTFEGSHLLLELHKEKFPQINFGSAKVREDGKFLLRANPGSYTLSLYAAFANEEKNLLGSVKVSVPNSGIFNATLKVKN